jgi:hypothetical protein
MTKPISIFTISTPPELAFIAKQNSVKIIEVLHGTGYTKLIWNWDKLSYEYLPNIIISFDDTSTKTFKQLENKGVEIYQIESIWEKRKETINYDDFYKKLNFFIQGKKNVLFTLTWGYANDHGEYNEYENILKNGLIPQTIIELFKETESSVNWLIRLHPVHLRNKIMYRSHFNLLKKLKKEHINIEWVETSNIPLEKVLKLVDCNITMSSMTAYEAAKNGVCTLFMCPTIGATGLKFRDLFESGFAEYIHFNQKLSILNYIKHSSIKSNKFNNNPEFSFDFVIKHIANSK